MRPRLWKVFHKLGRKNYLFCGNHDAAIRAAIIYSLIGSCKAVGVDPRQWMEDVLVRIPECDKNQDALAELLPNRWTEVKPNKV